MSRLIRILLLPLLVSGVGKASLSQAGTSPERPVGWREDGTGHYRSASPVTKWSTNENILWKTEIGAGQSSPIVVGERVFITVEPDLLVCVEANTGKELWRKSHKVSELPQGNSLRDKDPPSTGYGDVTPTPVSDGKRVWVFVGTGIVACYDVGGTRRWLEGFDFPLTSSYGRTASPVLVGERLLVHFGPLVCLDAATGKLLWKNEEAKANYGTPAVARIGGVEVVITPKGAVVRVSDGKTLASDLGNSMYASPVVQNNVAYFIDVDIAAVRLPDQATEPLKCKELWSGKLSGEYFASPVVYEGRIYAVDNTANFYVLDANTGKTVLERQLAFSRPDGLNLYPSLCMAGKHLFIGGDTGEMLVMQPGDEGVVVGSNLLPRGSGGTPAFNGRRMFVRGGKILYCIGR